MKDAFGVSKGLPSDVRNNPDKWMGTYAGYKREANQAGKDTSFLFSADLKEGRNTHSDAKYRSLEGVHATDAAKRIIRDREQAPRPVTMAELHREGANAARVRRLTLKALRRPLR